MQTLEIELINEKSNRLELVRNALNINKSKLAELVGSEQSHINKVLSGKVNLGKHLSDQIIRRLNLNPVWWESGEGDMFNNEKNDQESVQENISIYNVKERGSSSNANMWWVPAKAQGGFVRGFAHRMFFASDTAYYDAGNSRRMLLL